jgi:hypothetical protein
MAVVRGSNGGFEVVAYIGDAKTLLAFNLPTSATKDLAGFTIQVQPGTLQTYYLYNTLQFKTPSDHYQDSHDPPYSSINAPFHKFRWLHVPGTAHQGLEPFFGLYKYTVTPRYFDAKSHLLQLDATLSAALTVPVTPFKKGSLRLGFTRGFVQSQGFVNRFGLKAPIRPKAKQLLYDTSVNAGTNPKGQKFTFAEEYDWLGYTSRKQVFGIVNEVLNDNSLKLDMFAYDLNEPDLLKALLKLAEQGRLRVILDDAALHHSTKAKKPEDDFANLFNQKQTGNAALKRGHFGRYAHDKILIVTGDSAKKVLTGSTNFSVTGLYVNSNHTLIYEDPAVASKYAAVFDEVWNNGITAASFSSSPLSSAPASFNSNGIPNTSVTFSPHKKPKASELMAAIAQRVSSEKNTANALGSVLFAIMDLGSGDGPVRPALSKLHSQQTVFSYGISDTPSGIRLYVPKRKTGVLVTGKPTNTKLPAPFNQVPSVGIGHQIHHKFVVCGFNKPDAVVYCGSSNLATGGEEANGDNLLTIRDTDVATAFAIEAVALVDHFEFLDNYSQQKKAKKSAPASKTLAAVQADWFLSVGDGWTKKFYDPNDLRCVDRTLFAS